MCGAEAAQVVGFDYIRSSFDRAASPIPCDVDHSCPSISQTQRVHADGELIRHPTAVAELKSGPPSTAIGLVSAECGRSIAAVPAPAGWFDGGVLQRKCLRDNSTACDLGGPEQSQSLIAPLSLFSPGLVRVALGSAPRSPLRLAEAAPRRSRDSRTHALPATNRATSSDTRPAV